MKNLIFRTKRNLRKVNKNLFRQITMSEFTKAQYASVGGGNSCKKRKEILRKQRRGARGYFVDPLTFFF